MFAQAGKAPNFDATGVPVSMASSPCPAFSQGEVLSGEMIGERALISSIG